MEIDSGIQTFTRSVQNDVSVEVKVEIDSGILTFTRSVQSDVSQRSR